MYRMLQSLGFTRSHDKADTVQVYDGEGIEILKTTVEEIQKKLKVLKGEEQAFDAGLVKLIESEFNETKSQVMKDSINKVL